MATFGQSKYSVARDATVQAYFEAERGGVDTCDCSGCRNFRLARAQVFPPEFLSLLDQLGIDPRKDGEIYHVARLVPGRHIYGGWYHFVGTLHETGNFAPVDLGADFKVWICAAHAPRLQSLKDKAVVELNFSSEAVPWLLNEPEML